MSWRRNPWSRYVALSGSDPLMVGEVLAHRDDGSDTSLIELPGGGQSVASGQSVAVGAMAFVRGGKVEGAWLGGRELGQRVAATFEAS